jgi:2-polyprenyl-3-methyl-5-hydroxy-6-metoxy-1,4-benzoquinol methylase
MEDERTRNSCASGQKSLSDSRKHYVDSGLSFESIRHHLESNHAELIEQHSSSSRRLLEIGCGYGRMTSLIANHFAHFEVVGFDVSPQFIQIAKQQQSASSSTLLGDDSGSRRQIAYHVADAGAKLDEKLYVRF